MPICSKLCPVGAKSTAHYKIFFRLLEPILNTGTESVFCARNEPEPESLFCFIALNANRNSRGKCYRFRAKWLGHALFKKRRQYRLVFFSFTNHQPLTTPTTHFPPSGQSQEYRHSIGRCDIGEERRLGGVPQGCVPF